MKRAALGLVALLALAFWLVPLAQADGTCGGASGCVDSSEFTSSSNWNGWHASPILDPPITESSLGLIERPSELCGGIQRPLA